MPREKRVDFRAYNQPMGLVLCRKLGEQIVLTDGDTRITLTLVDSARTFARIAINTDKTWKIDRVDAPPGAVMKQGY